MAKRVLRSGFAVIVLLVSACGRPEAPASQVRPEVEVAKVQQQDVPIYREWVATLDGYVNAEIQARVDGYVVAQRFQEGSLVRKNDVLFEIDPRPFRAALDDARGRLAQSEAEESRAARDVERDRPLVQARAIPRAQLETDIDLHRAAAAAVQSARAQLRRAELDLSYTRVRSLIDGIVGITQVQIGNLVSPSSVLTTVSQVQPIKALFSISEQEYLEAVERLPGGPLEPLSHSSPAISFELTLSDGSKYPRRGRFLFADRQVDSLTGTLRIVTEFENPDRLLRPGQFARIRAATRVQRGALLVQQRAVTELQGSHQVAVIAADSTVHIRTVVIGPRVDSLWVIERGLRPGEVVVVEGTQKVRDGQKVMPRPYGAPAKRTRPPATG